MYYTIRHLTRYRYSAPVHESVMELRMQPRSDDRQHCYTFNLNVRPSARLFNYRDFHDNSVHHFSIAASHRELTVTADAVVEVQPLPLLSDSLETSAWDALDALAHNAEVWEWLQPGPFTAPTPMLNTLAADLQIRREGDPLNALRNLNKLLHGAFAYDSSATTVDSTIDDAIQQGKGVCQDFTHIMLAITRSVLHIPARYVSGYLFHGEDDRSDDDATHAWMEALLPGLGWIGFDPTNNLVAGERHIRVAQGRDYREAPPTHGILKGAADSELTVSVQVRRVERPVSTLDSSPASWVEDEAAATFHTGFQQPSLAQQQQQQQQQQ